MEIVFDEIHVPNKHSFIVRKLHPEPGRASRIHSHKNFELNFIIEGSGRRIVGNHISSYEPGDLVLMGPNLPHCWEISQNPENGKQKATCIVIHFYENITNSDFFNIPELESIEKLLIGASDGIWFKGDVVEQVYIELERLLGMEGLESYIQLLKVFNLLLKSKNSEVLSQTSSYPETFNKDLEKINRVYEYVFENIQEGLNLEEAASILNMAPGSFCRYFKKKTNRTFIQYVKGVRVGIAAKMLSETDKQITRICYESGYNNLANFNHQFKSIMGSTPSGYRKMFE
jgi:AraC-like DNA-binding protein